MLPRCAQLSWQHCQVRLLCCLCRSAGVCQLGEAICIHCPWLIAMQPAEPLMDARCTACFSCCLLASPKPASSMSRELNIFIRHISIGQRSPSCSLQCICVHCRETSGTGLPDRHAHSCLPSFNSSAAAAPSRWHPTWDCMAGSAGGLFEHGAICAEPGKSTVKELACPLHDLGCGRTCVVSSLGCGASSFFGAKLHQLL